MVLLFISRNDIDKKLYEKPSVCHYHKQQSTTDTKRKGQQNMLDKHTNAREACCVARYCCQFMHLVFSLLVLRAGYRI